MFTRKHSSECAQSNSLGHMTWRSYTKIKKKAMDQEFTWGGFILSLSIAFFIVGTVSSSLNTVYENFNQRHLENKIPTQIMQVVPPERLVFADIC